MCGLFPNLRNQIVDLSLYRTNVDFRIKQSGRTDNLLRPKQLMLFFIRSRRRRNEHHLIDPLFKFFKIQRSVIQRRRQTEAIIYKCLLPGTVTRIHTSNLRDCHMRLIYDHQKIISKIIQQGMWRCSRLCPIQMSGIVLNPRTKSGFPQHFDIEIRPF